MRDLSLHVLDLVENSLRAGATVVRVAVSANSVDDTLLLAVEDNGPGFSVPPEQLADPFFTTKGGKKTGLGLSLFRAAAQRADGEMVLGRSAMGGASVVATMKLSHVDRSPVGDLAATCSSIACTNPRLDLRVELSSGRERVSLSSRELARRFATANALSLASQLAEEIREAAGRVWPSSLT